ncbi:T9SS type A sorting domain-containing protein [Flavobacterium filum]|uniref:T9SS type A sorting domain-containing protein n=1 Tax=Flavobacterium filum TaxID=370974 RepID=UPI00041E23FE|nr:T9SS type A sorting domain-containing protein [Flavobacterium filum]
MNLKLIFLFLLLSNLLHSQTIDHILFEYDTAGNQIKRYTIDLNTGRSTNDFVKNTEDITKEDMILSDIYEDISYYPNPVKETLFIKWENNDFEYVTSIKLNSLSGQSLKSFTNLKGSVTLNIPFENLPHGLYTLVLEYSNGKQKTLKIIKN